MRKHLPSLFSLKAFESAARLGGFSKASEELNVTSAAVAHQVKKLEQELSVELFDRHPRGVSLSNAGQDYFAVTESLLDNLNRETQLFKAKNQSQPIRIGAMHIVSDRLVRPMVQKFIRQFPDVSTELIADMVEPSFRTGQFDVIIWHGATPPAQHLAIRILSETLTPVCSPEFLKDFQNGLTVEDIADVPALYDLHWQDDWQLWLDAAGGKAPQSSMGFSLYSMMIHSVIEGGGLAIGHTGLINQELMEGKLVRPFELEVPSTESYYALTTPEQLGKPGVKALWDWMQDNSPISASP